MKFYIKEARERVGLSQKELATSLGIKPTTFNGYENGTHDPKSDILVLIAKKCETSVDFLLGCTDDPTPQATIKKVPTENISESDPQKQRLLENYEALNPLGRSKLVDYSDDLADSLKYTEVSTETSSKKEA